jgi:hypothetical protein
MIRDEPGTALATLTAIPSGHLSYPPPFQKGDASCSDSLTVHVAAVAGAPVAALATGAPAANAATGSATTRPTTHRMLALARTVAPDTHPANCPDRPDFFAIYTRYHGNV